jgi:hypothetical protein
MLGICIPSLYQHSRFYRALFLKKKSISTIVTTTEPGPAFISANGFLFSDAPQFALRHEPSLATDIFKSSALGNFLPESGEQLLLRFVIS